MTGIDRLGELSIYREAKEPVGTRLHILPKLYCTEGTVFNDMKKSRLQFEENEDASESSSANRLMTTLSGEPDTNGPPRKTAARPKRFDQDQRLEVIG